MKKEDELMGTDKQIQQEISRFKRKFWLAKFLQGLLIFMGTGLVFFAIVALIEYASWLTVVQRTLLFWVTAGIEGVLFAVYLAVPMWQLISNGKRLADIQAAQIIGGKIEGIDDKLLNYLQLRSQERTDLIDAGLEQKGTELTKYSFVRAISYTSLKPFLLFLIPLFVLLLYLKSGNRWQMLAEGTNRLVNYSKIFERAFPFRYSFVDKLTVPEGDDYALRVLVKGDVVPEFLVAETSMGAITLQRQGGNTYAATLKNCRNDIQFRLGYDGISSEEYTISVLRKAAIGRVSIQVIPPAYTGIQAYSVENVKHLEVPFQSELRYEFVFKNTENLMVQWIQGTKVEKENLTQKDQRFVGRALRDGVVTAKVSGALLSEIEVNVTADQNPHISLEIDSSTTLTQLVLIAQDDYRLRKAELVFKTKDGKEESISIPVNGNSLSTSVNVLNQQLSELSEVVFVVQDQLHTVSARVIFYSGIDDDRSEKEALNDVGGNIQKLREEQENLANKRNAPSNKEKESLKQEAKQLEKQVEQLSEKDSIQYERMKQLSEELNKLLEKMDKKLPASQERMQENQLEELIEQLEKEWLILKTIDQLKTLDEQLKTEKAADEKLMQELNKSKEELKKGLDPEQTNNLDFKKFDELQEGNEQLEQNEGEGKDQKSKDSKKESKSSDEIKKEMKEDSDALKDQLSKMSDAMMMETMEKNIQLIRRLELRALKASTTQEALYKGMEASAGIDNSVISKQREVVQSASGVLDSLSILVVSDPLLLEVLGKNAELLQQNIAVFGNMQDIAYPVLQSNQRYLQFSLNDLASILYDILKSESKSMQSMMAGNKSCSNPKPGNGQKKSLGQQQKEFGEKMGKQSKPGQGKNGRQSLSQSELLELVKGQEQILDQFEKEHGGKDAGDSDIKDAMNKQLLDILNNDIDKAIARNKEIEDKLIELEKSENDKKEDDNKRKSNENRLDYDAIRSEVFDRYVKGAQSGTSVVNLPLLKQYYTAKWSAISKK